MSGEASRALHETAAALGRALAGSGFSYMLIGGVAVVARGYDRLTRDVDAKVFLGDRPIEALAAKLASEVIRPRRADALEFARSRQVFLLRHEPSGTPVDVSFAWLPFELESLGRASPVTFLGIDVPTAMPEDLIVSKAVAWRARDKDDIEHLLVRHGKSLEMKRIRAWVEQFAELLEVPERLAEFDEIVRRARSEV